MRKTMSQIREEMRKQLATKDKLVYLEKAPNGKVIEIHLLEWHTDEGLETWKKQSDLNKQEYLSEVKKEQVEKDNALQLQFQSITKALVEAQKQLERLEMEIKLIKGEINEEEYEQFIGGLEE